MTQAVAARQVVDSYIGGGWGADQISDEYTSPASVIRGTDFPRLRGGEVTSCPHRFHKASNLSSRILRGGDIVMEVSGGSKDQPVGRALLITDRLLAKFDGAVIPASFCKLLRPRPAIVEPGYLYFFLQHLYDTREIAQFQVQSTGISNFQFEAFLDGQFIPLPPLQTQRKIAAILSAYDDLIENNNRRIKILEEMAQRIYREWFVDFRYPGHEDVPLVGSELGPIPQGWSIARLGDVVTNLDRKRKPLSGLVRAERQGPYPYYGAARVFDYVDDYIFDGTYLLVAEDGSVIGPDGSPVLQYVDGQFWPNNHTHVLQGKRISTQHLTLMMRDVQISGYMTGAAQPKITQSNMNRIPVLLPPQEIRTMLDVVVVSMFASVISIDQRSARLRKSRDLLLPRLISGDVDVDGLNITVPDVAA